MNRSDPIACTLTPKDAASQLLEWEGLQRLATDAHAIPGGAQLTLPVTARKSVEALAERERGCCSFLTITTQVTDNLLTVTVTSGRPEAREIISALVGVT